MATSTTTNENARASSLAAATGTAGGTVTPLRQLDNSLDLIFASPRWAKTIDAHHQAAARGDPIAVPHTMVNPSLFLGSPQSHAQSLPQPHPQSQLRRLLPPAWLNGPPPASSTKQPLRPQPSVAASASRAPPPPLPAVPAPAPQATAGTAAPPVFHLHRRNDPTPLPQSHRPRHRGQTGAYTHQDDSNDQEQLSPPSPTILPTIRASARAAAAGAITTRSRRPSAHALAAVAAAAEPSASESSHQDSDEDEDDQQATIRRPTAHHQARQGHGKRHAPPLLVSTATSMTPLHPTHPPGLHRAPTPILDAATHDPVDADQDFPSRITRARARQLQQDQLTTVFLDRMQPISSLASCLITTVFSTMLSLVSFFVTRPIRRLSQRTGPIATFSLLFVLALLLLSWALEPDVPEIPQSPETHPDPPLPPSALDTLADRITDMQHATMQLEYQQDAVESADAAHHDQFRTDLTRDVTEVVDARVTEAVDTSLTRAVDAAVAAVLDNLDRVSTTVAHMSHDVANLTLRVDSHVASLNAVDLSSDDPAPPTLLPPPPATPGPELVNYASFPSGARALARHSSPTHTFPMHPNALIGGWLPARALPWFLRPGVPAHGHNWALHPDMQLGSCWATAAGAGGRHAAKLTVQLARPVRPWAVAIAHVVREGKPAQEAPRDVRVYGRRVRDGEWYMLAKGEYRIQAKMEDRQVEARQVLEVTPQSPLEEHADDNDNVVDQVRFVFERNWGRKEYMCLYRVEVLAPASPATKPGDEGKAKLG